MVYYSSMTKKQKRKKIVLIGGGTGTSTLLKGLKEYSVALSVIVTTADDGGSSGRLRQDFNMPPPGDARQCLAALADSSHPIVARFNDRFERGELKGHSFGNIVLALLYQQTGDFQKALDEARKIFHIRGRVIPVVPSPLTLCAALKNGSVLRGEEAITSSMEIARGLDYLYVDHGARANKEAVRAIERADAVVVGPGNFFSSILPNFLVDGIGEAVRATRAKKIYVANLLTQPGHTDGFALEDFLEILARYIGEDVFDDVIYNTEKVAPFVRRKFGVRGEEVRPRSLKGRTHHYRGLALLDKKVYAQNPSDPLQRTLIRHDSKKLAKAILSVLR